MTSSMKPVTSVASNKDLASCTGSCLKAPRWWAQGLASSAFAEGAGDAPKMWGINFLWYEHWLFRVGKEPVDKFLLFKEEIIYLPLAVLAFRRCMPTFYSCGGAGGCSPVDVPGLLMQWLRLCGARAPGHTGSIIVIPGLQSAGSAVIVLGLSSSTVAGGVFLDQGSNPCLLSWQMDSLPLSHQGSPRKLFLVLFLWAVWKHSFSKAATPWAWAVSGPCYKAAITSVIYFPIWSLPP